MATMHIDHRRVISSANCFGDSGAFRTKNWVVPSFKCGRLEEVAMCTGHHRDNPNAKYVDCGASLIETPMVSSAKCGKIEEITGIINPFPGHRDVKDGDFDSFSAEGPVASLVNLNTIEAASKIGRHLHDPEWDTFSIGNRANASLTCDRVEETVNNLDCIWQTCDIKDVCCDACSRDNRVSISVRCGGVGTADSTDHVLCQNTSSNAFSVDNRAAISGNCRRIEAIAEITNPLLPRNENSDDFSIESLVNTLVRCDRLEDALQNFYTVLPRRTIFTWTALIRGFTECGKAQEALKIYESMLKEGIEPNAYTFVSLFKACGHLCDLDNGRALHAYAQRKGLGGNLFIANSLISMYGKSGDIAKAEEVFCNLLQRDIISWNAMLSAYLEQCDVDVEKALQTYQQIYEEGLEPNPRTFVISLQLCCILKEREEDHVGDREHQVGSLELGRAIHSDARRTSLDKNLFVLNALMSMYSKCGSISDVLNTFRASSHLDTVSWNTLISAYADKGLEEEALQLYHEMHMNDFSPNAWTFVIAFQAFYRMGEKEEYLEQNRSSNMSLKLCWALHADAVNAGLDSSSYVGTTLVKLYGKCGSTSLAEIAFARLQEPTIVSWNAMLSAYVDQGEAERCLGLFSRTPVEGKASNEESLIIALQACCKLVEQGKHTLASDSDHSLNTISLISGYAVHAEAQKKGFDDHTPVGNALLDMYAKCGSIACCQNVFDHMLHHDIISWTTILVAYANHGRLEEALDVCNLMAQQGMVLSEITLVCILQACSKMGSAELCMHVHFIAISSGYDQSLLVANSLIDAYGACGEMDDALAVFNHIPAPTVVSWSSLAAGYAQGGDYGSSVKSFESMLEEDITPNEVTIQAVVSVLNHAGCVDECIRCLLKMREYGLTLDARHYASMIDLLGRAGDFSKVDDMMMMMMMMMGVYIEPNVEMWLSLLSACRNHGNSMLAKYAFDRAVSLDPERSAAYVLMSSMWGMNE